MKLDIQRAQKKHKGLKAKMSGDLFRARQGRNKIRVLPWSKKTGRMVKGDEEAEFFADRTVHFAKPKAPPEDCLGEKCPYCDRAELLAASDDEADQQLARRVGAREQTVFLVYDVSADEPKVVPYPACTSVAGPIIAYALDEEEYPDFLDYAEGRAVIIEFDRNALPQDMYAVTPGGKPTSVPKPVLKQIDVSKFDIFGFGGSGKAAPEPAGDKPEEEKKKGAGGKGKGKGKGGGKKKKEPEDEPEDDRPDCFGAGWEKGDKICSGCKHEAACEEAM